MQVIKTFLYVRDPDEETYITDAERIHKDKDGFWVVDDDDDGSWYSVDEKDKSIDTDDIIMSSIDLTKIPTPKNTDSEPIRIIIKMNVTQDYYTSWI